MRSRGRRTDTSSQFDVGWRLAHRPGQAERLLRNFARRLEQVEPGVAGSILEGLEEILTVIRLGLPQEFRRSLACTANVNKNRDIAARNDCMAI